MNHQQQKYPIDTKFCKPVVTGGGNYSKLKTFFVGVGGNGNGGGTDQVVQGVVASFDEGTGLYKCYYHTVDVDDSTVMKEDLTEEEITNWLVRYDMKAAPEPEPAAPETPPPAVVPAPVEQTTRDVVAVDQKKIPSSISVKEEEDEENQWAKLKQEEMIMVGAAGTTTATTATTQPAAGSATVATATASTTSPNDNHAQPPPPTTATTTNNTAEDALLLVSTNDDDQKKQKNHKRRKNKSKGKNKNKSKSNESNSKSNNEPAPPKEEDHHNRQISFSPSTDYAEQQRSLDRSTTTRNRKAIKNEWKSDFFFPLRACLCLPCALGDLMERINLQLCGPHTPRICRNFKSAWNAILFVIGVYLILLGALIAPLSQKCWSSSSENEPESCSDMEKLLLVLCHNLAYLLICFVVCILALTRYYIRRRDNIATVYCPNRFPYVCEDICCSCWCSTLTLIQMHRHVENEKECRKHHQKMMKMMRQDEDGTSYYDHPASGSGSSSHRRRRDGSNSRSSTTTRRTSSNHVNDDDNDDQQQLLLDSSSKRGYDQEPLVVVPQTYSSSWKAEQRLLPPTTLSSSSSENATTTANTKEQPSLLVAVEQEQKPATTPPPPQQQQQQQQDPPKPIFGVDIV